MSRTGNVNAAGGVAHRARPGFTIVELIVVIVVLAVLAGMTAPMLIGSYRAAELRESARRLHLAAQYARAYAATRGEHCRLVIESGEQRYRLTHQPVDGRGEYQPLQAALHGEQTLSGDVRFGQVRVDPRAEEEGASESGTAARFITFTPNGQADAAMIELTDGSEYWTVRIAPSSGRAELLAGQADSFPPDRIDLDA